MRAFGTCYFSTSQLLLERQGCIQIILGVWEQSIREGRFRPRNDIDTKIQDLDESFKDDDPAYIPLQWDSSVCFNGSASRQICIYTELIKIDLIVGTLNSNPRSHLAV